MDAWASRGRLDRVLEKCREMKGLEIRMNGMSYNATWLLTTWLGLGPG